MDNLQNNPENKLLELYNAAPYPESLGEFTAQQGTPLLQDWINAAVAPSGIAIHTTSNFLMAGCGSGDEAIAMAQKLPYASITGIDFSPRSIDLAKEKAAKLKLKNVWFEVADLTTQEWCSKYDKFDFVLCHGVADYVGNPKALLDTLSLCLSEKGVLCMTANTPFHPSHRIRAAFKELGLCENVFTDSVEQRQLMQTIDGLIKDTTSLNGLGSAPAAYLKVDIFAPIAHHYSIDTWCNIAESAGLNFCGSMDAPVGLTQLSDASITPLLALNKVRLSLWMAHLRQRPGMQLLFSHNKPNEPDFSSKEAILAWQPKLSASIGQLPALNNNASQSLPLRLRFEGLPDFVINSTAFDLEVFRRCDGSHSISSLIGQIPEAGNFEALKIHLYKAYHFGILHNT